jgi:hypothetical protein
MSDRDNMLVLRAGNAPRTLFSRPSFDKKFLRQLIEAQTPGIDQTMDLPKALDQAYDLLGRSTLPRHRMVLFTDGHRHGWRDQDPRRWEQLKENRDRLKVQPHLYVFELRPDRAPENIAVQDLYARSPVVDVYRPSDFQVELNNTTGKKKQVNVSWRVDGTVQEERQLACPPGAHTVTFRHQFKKSAEPAGPPAAGAPAPAEPETQSHVVEASIKADDLPMDDSRALALEVRLRIPVLIIDGGSVGNVWESRGGLAALALESAGAYGGEGLFAVTHRSQADLDDSSPRALEAYRAVILADVPSLSRNLQFALEQFVKNGGGLLIAAGPHADAAFYNRLYDEGRGLMPAVLRETVEYKKGEEPFHPRFPAGAASHVLDIFDTTQTRVLNEVRVTRYWRCSPSAEALVLALVQDDPIILQKNYGAGVSALWALSLGQDGSNFPLTQDYLPLVQNLAISLSAVVQPPINLAQLDPLVFSIPAEEARDSTTGQVPTNCLVRLPGGGQAECSGATVGGQWVATWRETLTTGVYAVEFPGRDPKYHAVAYQPGEENPARLENDHRERFQKSVVHRFVNSPAEYEAAVQQETGVSEGWRWCVFIALALLCLELFLGWRVSA